MPDDNRNLPVVVKRGRGRSPGWGFYCPEVVEEIVDRMCHGETLIDIVETDSEGYRREPGTFPSYRTIDSWADPNHSNARPDFVTAFARARLVQNRFWMEKTVQIAFKPELGIEETLDIHPKFGTTLKRVKKDMLGHRALKIDTLLKYLSRVDPPKYNERLQQAAPKDEDGDGADRLIIEGGLPDNEPPPPPTQPPTSPPDEEQ